MLPPLARLRTGTAVPCWLALLVVAAPCKADFRITPSAVELAGNYARAQLLVTEIGTNADLTHQAVYQSLNSKVAKVSPGGRLLALANGQTTISVTAAGISHTVSVRVTSVAPSPRVGFLGQVVPVLSRAGCNAGACHASQFGKGGFKLSVFAYAPDEDYRAIVRAGFSRRVNFIQPEHSLFLLKPTARVQHGGGHRLQVGSVDYQILRQWLASGAPGPETPAPEVTALYVEPARRVGAVGLTQQLRVMAQYRDGSARDVTCWTKFDSMDEGVLQVRKDGVVTTIGRGQGAAMARFAGQAAIATFVVPYTDHVELTGWVNQNFVDSLAAAKFREIGITPSPLCDDATFLRRAYLDVTGTLPTPREAAAFLDSKDPQKRSRLIDQLLGLTGDPAQDTHNNEYAAYWSLKWADLIRANSTVIGEQGMWALDNWIRDSFRQNKPFDRFVRELITAQGSTFSNGPANYYRLAASPQDRAEATSQTFLGVRLQCAKCHHHPFESYSQDDYYSFAAFFARVGSKTSQDFGVFENEQIVVVREDGEVANPRTGKVLAPRPLEGQPIVDKGDRRLALAKWLTSSRNPFFARNVVNRYVAYLLGRGLVEPIDDMRPTNPASNEALLEALTQDFIRHGYDIKQLLRTIMNSRLYQLSSQPLAGNATDGRFYSHYVVKRLAAEPLLDAIDQATGTHTKFPKLPAGTRAIELPDAQYDNYFLKTFGKPRREGVCECERVSEPNLAQALDTLNSDVITAKIADPQGRLAKLLAAKEQFDQIVDELYLATLSRRPTLAERAACHKLRAVSQQDREFYQDLLWSLLNSKHFLFVR